jgi:hypothetical protein
MLATITVTTIKCLVVVDIEALIGRAVVTGVETRSGLGRFLARMPAHWRSLSQSCKVSDCIAPAQIIYSHAAILDEAVPRKISIIPSADGSLRLNIGSLPTCAAGMDRGHKFRESRIGRKFVLGDFI